MKFNYEHGGDIYTEGLLKGRELIDFSSNINPLGVPDSFKSHINEAVEKASYYPDVCYRELIENLKGYLSKDYKIDGLNYILGNGAVDVIDKVIGLFKKVLITVPCFSEYESIALRWENKVVYSYLNDQMEYDYRDIEKKINDVDALIIANPNNPSGNIIHKEKFMDIIKLCEDKKKTIIIDEAFVEFTGDKNQSFIAETHEYKCLFVIRALTKYFGLPGIRFGYAVTSNNNLKNQIEKYQNTWNINCFAEVAAKYVLKDYKYIEDSQKWIRQEKKFMLEELTKIKIIEKVYNTHSNFILAKLKGILGEQLYRKAMDNGIAIRRAANFKGLDDNFVRLAIKSREDNKKLLEVLKL